jgi:hypothetical protein
MTPLQTFLVNYWPWITGIALAILIVLLWRNFDIDEITPAPPFIKFKRKTKSAGSSQVASINVTGNTIKGKNKISIRRNGSNVSDNTFDGENELQVGAKPGRKPKNEKK